MIVVGVRFKPAGKIYYFDPATIELKLDDGVIVETARGMEFGHVVIAPRSADSSEVVQPLKPIIRKATAKDIRQVEKNKEREKKAFVINRQNLNGAYRATKFNFNLIRICCIKSIKQIF